MLYIIISRYSSSSWDTHVREQCPVHTVGYPFDEHRRRPLSTVTQLQHHFPQGYNDPKVYSTLALVASQQQQHKMQAKSTPT